MVGLKREREREGVISLSGGNMFIIYLKLSKPSIKSFNYTKLQISIRLDYSLYLLLIAISTSTLY